jgi:TolB-like protein
LFAHAGDPRIHSLAVLPLEDLSGDPAQEYFADGMTDELITRLAQNQALRVISRTSVMQYKKVHRPLADVARELGVDGILEGSVERSGNRESRLLPFLQSSGSNTGAGVCPYFSPVLARC